MRMNIKGTECEDVEWIYILQGVVNWCTRTSDLHKRMEILLELRKNLLFMEDSCYGVSLVLNCSC